MDKSSKDNRANQLNKNNDRFQAGNPKAPQDKPAKDNKCDQQNPNNDKYAKARNH